MNLSRSYIEDDAGRLDYGERPMNNDYIIDLTGVKSRDELHDRIEEILPVPGWYGRNLDARYDILTEPELGKGGLVCFIGCADLRSSIPRYYAAMQQMCSAACEENPGLAVEFVD